MIKSYSDYKELALRSIKPHESKNLAIADWALGLGGELGEVIELLATSTELDRMEIAKEIGDILWYGTALEEELNLNIDFGTIKENSGNSICNEEGMPLLVELSLLVCKIQEDVKHLICHKEGDKTDAIREKIHQAYRLVRDMCDDLDMDIRDCAALNAAKLAHRYNLKEGGGYTQSASKNRHQAEIKFENTATFKKIYAKIMNDVVDISDDDVEVL